MKDPAFLFYSQDFFMGVSNMTMEERGQYITLLCIQHQKGHMDEKTIRLLVGEPSVSVLEKFIQDEEGSYFNDRLDIEIEKRANFVESRRANGLKGGRPKKASAKPSAKPSGKASKNLSEDENENENVINLYIIKNNYSFMTSQTIKDWLQYKKERKDKYKPTGFKALLTKIKNNIDTHGEDAVIKVINTSIASNYKGIIFDSLEKKSGYSNNKTVEKEPTWHNKEIKTKESDGSEIQDLLKDFE